MLLSSCLCRSTLFSLVAAASSTLLAQSGLDVANYDEQGRLLLPTDLVSWVHVGSTLGNDYRDAPFDPAHPAVIGVVQMEPTAWRHFNEHGSYADGSMFLLSFHAAESRSQPQLQGFVQGALQAREIHVIDKQRFEDGRAFFMYQPGEQGPSAALPAGNDCVTCHEAEGAYDGTFIQFYPPLRELPR